MSWNKINQNCWLNTSGKIFFYCDTQELKSECEKIIGDADILGIIAPATFVRLLDIDPKTHKVEAIEYYFNEQEEIEQVRTNDLELPQEVLKNFI